MSASRTGRCEMTMPGGYELDPGGVDTWVSADRRIFIGLESVGYKEAASLDAAEQRATEHLKTVIGNYQETNRAKAYETRRVNFSGTLGQGTGWGTLYLRQFGRDFCQITIIAAEGTVVLLDPILETMVSSLRVLLVHAAPDRLPGAGRFLRRRDRGERSGDQGLCRALRQPRCAAKRATEDRLHQPGRFRGDERRFPGRLGDDRARWEFAARERRARARRPGTSTW